MKYIIPNKALNYRIFQRKLKGRSSLILNFMNNELKLEERLLNKKGDLTIFFIEIVYKMNHKHGYRNQISFDHRS